MKASKPADRQPLGWRYGPPLALLFAVCVIYANSLDNAFVFDDLVYIVDNPDIQQIWPLWQSPTESTWPALNARPLVRLTLAFNYALHGLEPRGYHLVNLGIHLLCSLSIYGLARRALAAVHFDGDAPGLGLAIAMVWTVHPINSECINYLSQRSESLMALFYLLTLYCTLRGRLDIRSAQWNIAAVSCAVLGTLSKEVIATAPLIVLSFEWIIGTQSPAKIIRERWPLYAGLVATWLLLVGLSLTPQGLSIGFSSGITSWDYLLNQAAIITDYLRLCFWPHPLVFDYGFARAMSLADVWPQFMLLTGLVVLSGYALSQRRASGFLGLAFFAILAPTSSIVPIINEVGAERRLYMPLVALVALVVTAVYRLILRLAPRNQTTIVATLAALTVVTGLGWTTIERNRDYRSRMTIWNTVAAVRPDNPRAFSGLGRESEKAGDIEKAVQLYDHAMELMPEFYEYIRLNRHVAYMLISDGKPQRAIPYYRRVVAERPADVQAHRDLAYTLDLTGDTAGAIEHYLQVIGKFDSFDLHNHLALLLHGVGNYRQAGHHFEKVITHRPDYAPAFNNLGTCLASQGRYGEAIAQFEQAIRLYPDYEQARTNLAAARATLENNP